MEPLYPMVLTDTLERDKASIIHKIMYNFRVIGGISKKREGWEGLGVQGVIKNM